MTGMRNEMTPSTGRTDGHEPADTAPAAHPDVTAQSGETTQRGDTAQPHGEADALGCDRRTALASGLLGGLLLVAAILVIVDAVRLPDTGAVMGPAAVPLPVGVLLGAVGAVMLLRAPAEFRRTVPGVPAQSGAALRVALLTATLVGFAVLLPILGYVLCSAALFAAAAWLLGGARGWRVPALGWALAAIVFIVFDRLIGLTLPAGPWGF